jgi:uncharacterized membrane protein
MSLEGTAAGLVSAAALAGLAVGLAIVPGSAMLPIVAGATVGALAESLLAAAFEPSGVLNNDALNLINTAIAAYVTVSVAGLLS